MRKTLPDQLNQLLETTATNLKEYWALKTSVEEGIKYHQNLCASLMVEIGLDHYEHDGISFHNIHIDKEGVASIGGMSIQHKEKES